MRQFPVNRLDDVAGTIRTSARLMLLLALCQVPGSVANAQTQQAGDASLRLEYQFIDTGTFYTPVREFDYWTTDSHVLLLSGDYALGARWTLYGAIPYVQKRFNAGVRFAGDPHNPNDPRWVDFIPPDKRFIDDGHYHGGLQDLSVGVAYHALDGPLEVSPYIGYGYPADNYPFYGKAAIGANLWNVPVGLQFRYVPHFSDGYVDGNVAYVFSEKPLGVNVDYWLAHLAAGYWFTPGFSVNVFVDTKYVREGRAIPVDFLTPQGFFDFDSVEWWQHDRLLRHRFVNVGAGFNYALNPEYLVSGAWYTGVWAEQANEVDFALTLAVTRFFSGD